MFVNKARLIVSEKINSDVAAFLASGNVVKTFKQGETNEKTGGYKSQQKQRLEELKRGSSNV